MPVDIKFDHALELVKNGTPINIALKTAGTNRYLFYTYISEEQMSEWRLACAGTKKGKKESVYAQVTTRLTGKTKNAFFEEIQRTGELESRLARRIIKNHYEEKERNHKMSCE